MKRASWSCIKISALKRDSKSPSSINIYYFTTAKIYKGIWNIEANRRNFGIKKCLGDWILEIDADEHVPKQLFTEIRKKIIEPTLKGIADLGTKYKGFLYAGLMIVNNEPYLIEYNVRMGDPETQVVMQRIKSDIVPLLVDPAQGK